MGPFNAPVFVFTVCLCLKTSFAYMEALAAHADTGIGKFEPEVAFICNKPAMHRVVNGWEPDYNTDCLETPEDILEYCKKTYPDHDIKNVIETTYKLEIPNWPKFEERKWIGNKNSHKITPFKCLVGDFESEALLVPQHCVFDHEHDSSRCERPSNWTRTASEECGGRDMVLESSGMLVICGTDKFRGVEYVCCPKESKAVTPKPSWSSESESKESSSAEDNYHKYLHGDDMSRYDNEHMKFKVAEKDMQKIQHEKVTKMMKEWQEAREHVSEMRKSDKKGAEQLNKEITERFQRMYHAFEQEGLSEKKQLVSLHQQRVQGMFNKKKRILMKEYKEQLESDEPKTSKILSYLKQYIRTEEKDRLHSVNHYEHVRDTDPEEAIRIRESIQKHLTLISNRIEDAIDMLKRLPKLEKKIRPEIAEFRNNKFRDIELSSDDVIAMPIKKQDTPAKVLQVDTVLDSQAHDYTNIVIDSEGLDATDMDGPVVAHQQNDGQHLNQAEFTQGTNSAFNHSYSNLIGIAVGSVAVFIIVVVAVVMLRKRNRRQPITHGFVEVDPAASPEERHVANMQMNGYENPTYRYFEVSN